MALRNIVTQGDPILNKKCRPVTEFDEKLANLLDDMFETMHNANGVGLAGPQVGILRRVVVIDAEDEDIELVNPEIVSVSDETQTGLEGCLSLPGKWGIVTRPLRATVRAQDRYGDWYEYEIKEMLAEIRDDVRFFRDAAHEGESKGISKAKTKNTNDKRQSVTKQAKPA